MVDYSLASKGFEKHVHLNLNCAYVMPRLTENQRLRAVGMLEAGMAQNEVARHFGVYRNTISWRRFQQNANTRDLPRTSTRDVTSARQPYSADPSKESIPDCQFDCSEHSWLTSYQFQDCTEPPEGAQHTPQTAYNTSRFAPTSPTGTSCLVQTASTVQETRLGWCSVH